MKKTINGKGGGGAQPANRSVNASLVHTANASINRDPARRRAIEPRSPRFDDSVFDDFESDEQLEKWRGEECDPGTVTDERYRQTTRPAQAARFADEAVTLPRHLASYGVVCNPWLDYHRGVKGALYAPLLDWIAERRDLKAGAKIFYSACLRRARTAAYRGVRRDWLRVDKLVEETGNTAWTVNNYIRVLKERRLIVKSRGVLHLAGPGFLSPPHPVKATKDWLPGLHLDELSDAEYREFCQSQHKSYIPATLMAFDGVSDQAKIVYGRLHGLAGKKGFWFGKNKALAEECGCVVATLRSAVRQLEEKKMIRVGRHGTGAGRRAERKPGIGKGGGENVYHFLGHRLFRERTPTTFESDRRSRTQYDTLY